MKEILLMWAMLAFVDSYAYWRKVNYLNHHFKLYSQKSQQSISPFANDTEANAHKNW